MLLPHVALDDLNFMAKVQSTSYSFCHIAKLTSNHSLPQACSQWCSQQSWQRSLFRTLHVYSFKCNISCRATYSKLTHNLFLLHYFYFIYTLDSKTTQRGKSLMSDDSNTTTLHCILVWTYKLSRCMRTKTAPGILSSRHNKQTMKVSKPNSNLLLQSKPRSCLNYSKATWSFVRCKSRSCLKLQWSNLEDKNVSISKCCSRSIR